MHSYRNNSCFESIFQTARIDGKRGKVTRMKNNSLCKWLAAVSIAVALLLISGCITKDSERMFGLGGVTQAAALQHVKATSSDVLQSNYNNLKGVQGTEIASGEESIAAMNLNHMMFNVDLTQVINTDKTGTPYEYDGKIYYFNEQEGSMMKVWQAEVKKYREQGVAMTFCLVMSWSDNPAIQKLMYNPTPGKIYYALNVTNAEAREQIAAILHYMADRFGYSDTFVQNWRVGNEVNVSMDYNYSGADGDITTMKTTLVNLAAQSYNLLYDALRDENPYAKAYVSVTHDWKYDVGGTAVPTKDFLDAFATKVKDKNWNLDFHAYPAQMNEQVWTKASGAYMRHDEDTLFVCAANLEVLTNYIKNHFGSNHRIIMSEQSFDSTYGEEEQAAMIAYTYYAAANSGMVDAVIFTTWKDTNSVYHDYYKMGFLTYEGRKKASYNVFKYMNTSEAATYVNPYLQKLSQWTGRNITGWSSDILYQAPATSVTLSSANLYYPPDSQTAGSVFVGMSTNPAYSQVDIEYRWTAFNYTTHETITISGWALNNEWLKWYPSMSATYRITCTARIAGNTSSVMSSYFDIGVTVPKGTVTRPTVSAPAIWDVVDDGPDSLVEGRGDIDGNGVVELIDAQMALKAALKIITLDADKEVLADADGNGIIELADAQAILKAALKII